MLASHGDRVLRRDRGQIDELEVDVLERHHARLGMLRRERILGDVRAGTGQARMQQRLPGIRRPEQRDLRGAFGADHQRGATVPASPARAPEFAGQVLDPRLDVGLQVFGSLVLGNDAQHLPQQLQPLARIAGAAVGGLGRLVLGAQVGGHPG